MNNQPSPLAGHDLFGENRPLGRDHEVVLETIAALAEARRNGDRMLKKVVANRR